MPNKTDTTSTAQGRFVVSLPAEVRKQIEEIGARLTAATEKDTGVPIEFSPAQIVQSLVRKAINANPGE